RSGGRWSGGPRRGVLCPVVIGGRGTGGDGPPGHVAEPRQADDREQPQPGAGRGRRSDAGTRRQAFARDQTEPPEVVALLDAATAAATVAEWIAAMASRTALAAHSPSAISRSRRLTCRLSASGNTRLSSLPALTMLARAAVRGDGGWPSRTAFRSRPITSSRVCASATGYRRRVIRPSQR